MQRKIILIKTIGFGLTLNPFYKLSAHPAIILRMYLLILFNRNPSSCNINCLSIYALLHWKSINNVYRLHCHARATGTNSSCKLVNVIISNNSYICFQGPRVWRLPLPPAIRRLWCSWPPGSPSAGQSRPGREYF